MKLNFLIVPVFILGISAIGCQNKATQEEQDHNSMNMGDDSSETASGMNGNMESPMMQTRSKMIGEMSKMEMTGNADVDFAMMMRGHHQGALDMAAEELRSGEDTSLKQMAQKISDDQKAEIKQLQDFVDANKNSGKDYDPTKKNERFAKTMDESMMVMMNTKKMNDHASASTDQQFVEHMLVHHQSSVVMAKGFLPYAKDESMKSLANKIIEEQNKEIEAFKKWNNQNKE